jgi:hypothetical protein
LEKDKMRENEVMKNIRDNILEKGEILIDNLVK